MTYRMGSLASMMHSITNSSEHQARAALRRQLNGQGLDPTAGQIIEEKVFPGKAEGEKTFAELMARVQREESVETLHD